MAIDELFGPDGTQPLPPGPVLADPLGGLVTGEFLAAEVVTPVTDDGQPPLAPLIPRSAPRARRDAAPPKQKRHNGPESWSYAPPEIAPAKPATAVGRPAISPGRKPVSGRPAPERPPVRGGSAWTVRNRRSGGGVVTTIIVIVVLALIYFGGGILHVVTQLFHH